MRNCNVYTNGAKAIAELIKHTTSLKLLDLESNKFKNDSLEARTHTSTLTHSCTHACTCTHTHTHTHTHIHMLMGSGNCEGFKAQQIA